MGWVYIRDFDLNYAIWIVLFWAFSFYRIAQTKSFFRALDADKDGLDVQKWDRAVKLILVVTGFMWSFIGFYGLSVKPIGIAVASLLVTTGVSATAIVSYPGFEFIVRYWIPLVKFPLLLPMLFGPHKDLRFLVITVFSFYASALVASRNNLKLVVDVFNEREKSKSLARDLDKTLRDFRESAQEVQVLQQKNVHSSKMAALGEMAAGVAHEVNNPLAVIKGKADQLKRAVHLGRLDPEVVGRTATVISETAERIAKIIRGLRSFARDGESDPFQRATLQTILDESFELCRSRFHHNGIELRVAGEMNGLQIECRSVQIGQVVLNLLNNAADAVLPLPEKWIQLEVHDRGEMVDILVTDSGHGIPFDVAQKIMQPFFTTKEIGKGTGLGLSISVGIARSHHGELVYDASCPNTRFRLSVPKRQPADEEVIVHASAPTDADQKNNRKSAS